MNYLSIKNGGKVGLFVLLMTITTPAFATTGGLSNIGNFLQQVIDFLTGPFGISIATLAIIGAGIMAMFGRLDASIFVRLLIGMSLVFGAAFLVNLFVGA